MPGNAATNQKAKQKPRAASQRDVATKLRRIALAQQGLNKPAAFGRGIGGARRALEQIGYVQIDTISVVERAHHHVFFSRVPNYEPKLIDRLINRGEAFEYWAHAAAYLPMCDYRFALPRQRSFREDKERWVRSRDKKLMAEVLTRIRDDGPLKSRDFEDTNHEASGWWNWKPAKRALEQLFMQGDLLITGRDGFQKTYDLPERALPADVDTREPTPREFAAYLVDTTLRAHGFAALKSFTHGRRGGDLRKDVRAVLAEREELDQVLRLRTPEGTEWFVDREAFEKRAPTLHGSARLLSPFDNLVILRDRLNSLFEFDYTIECYVTEKKRQYGYFCLPILLGDRLIGRVDAKAHRDQQRLELKALHLEQHLSDEDVDSVAHAVQAFALFNGCNHCAVTATYPKSEARRFRQLLE